MKKVYHAILMVSLTVFTVLLVQAYMVYVLGEPAEWAKLVPITAILCIGIAQFCLRSSD